MYPLFRRKILRTIFRFITGIIKFVVCLIFIICLIGAGMAAYAFYIAPDRLTTEDINVESSLVSRDIDVAVIADTHFGAGFEAEDFDKVIDKINAEDVDIVLFLGDLIDDYNRYTIDDFSKGTGDPAVISEKLSEINASLGKFAVFGNHDYGGGAENHYEDIMNAGGFTVLKNESHVLPGTGLRLIGIDDLLLGYGSVAISESATSDMYDLILCHEPDIYDKLTGDNIDFMFAGHTHGGQINIPYLRDRFLPSLGSKYLKGEYSDGISTLYVNPGLGTTKIKARLFAEPEITYLHIKSI